ncbi:hypothetical protein GGI43DRAFT_204404 [Trichoderma evansii]
MGINPSAICPSAFRKNYTPIALYCNKAHVPPICQVEIRSESRKKKKNATSAASRTDNPLKPLPSPLRGIRDCFFLGHIAFLLFLFTLNLKAGQIPPSTPLSPQILNPPQDKTPFFYREYAQLLDMRAPYPWKPRTLPQKRKKPKIKIKNDSRKIGYDPRSIFFGAMKTC